LDPQPFEGVASRLMLISGETGLSVGTTERAHERLPGAQRHVLRGYDAAGWSDVVADRTAELTDVIVGFLGGAGAPDVNPAQSKVSTPQLPAGSGKHAGLTYRI